MDLQTRDGVKEIKHIDALNGKEKDINDLIEICLNEPLRIFYEKLQRVNDMIANPLYKIGVTKTLMWKAGTYEQIRKWLNIRLGMHKKATNVHHLIDRTRLEANRLRWINSTFSDMEHKRAQLRYNGITLTKEDKDLQRTKVTEKINSLIKGINGVNNNFSKIQSNCFYDVEENWLNSKIRIRFVLSNINIKVYTSESRSSEEDMFLCDVPFDKSIVLEFSSTITEFLRDEWRINQCNGLINDRKGILFPYIARPYQNRYEQWRPEYEWTTVCLDKFQSDIFQSLKVMDLPLAATQLLQWAQYYHNIKGNPYNNIETTLLGYPKEIEKLFPTLAPGDGSSCYQRLSSHFGFDEQNGNAFFRTDESLEMIPKIKKHCEEIDCLFKDRCNIYSNMNRFNNSSDDTIEGFLGELVETYGDDFNSTEYQDILIKLDLGFYPASLNNFCIYLKNLDKERILELWTYWKNEFSFPDDDNLSKEEKLKLSLEAFHKGVERTMPF